MRRTLTAAFCLLTTSAAADPLPGLGEYLATVKADVTTSGVLRVTPGRQSWFISADKGAIPAQFALDRETLSKVQEHCANTSLFSGCDLDIDAGVSVEKGSLMLTIFSARNIKARSD